VKILALILGDYHTTAPIETFTVSKNDRHPTELAKLRGARLVTATETERGRRWDETKVKLLTGGDEISARFMGKDFFDFTPLFKLMISGNYKPGLRSVDEAIRRRLRLVPFNVTFPLDKRDLKLVEKLTVELPGIALWMIEGCAMWQRDGLNPPKAVTEATAAYLRAEDVIGTWISECCTLDKAAWTRTSLLYDNYGNYATAAGEFKINKREFSDALDARDDLKIQHKEEGNGYCGVRVGVAAPQAATSVATPAVAAQAGWPTHHERAGRPH
jgi:putative DNA primase/helicase